LRGRRCTRTGPHPAGSRPRTDALERARAACGGLAQWSSSVHGRAGRHCQHLCRGRRKRRSTSPSRRCSTRSSWAAGGLLPSRKRTPGPGRLRTFRARARLPERCPARQRAASAGRVRQGLTRRSSALPCGFKFGSFGSVLGLQLQARRLGMHISHARGALRMHALCMRSARLAHQLHATL